MSKADNSSEKKSRKVFSLAEKKRAVSLLDSGAKTFKEVMTEFGVVARNTLWSWIQQYSEAPEQHSRRVVARPQKRAAALRVIHDEASVHDIAAEFKVSLYTVWAWIRETRKELSLNTTEDGSESVIASKEAEELAALRLKVSALETMIDLAEAELGVDIRKKSGTKQ